MILDVHQHVGSLANLAGSAEVRSGSAQAMAQERAARERQMSELGIDQCVVMPGFEYVTTAGAASVREVNDHLAEYVAASDFVRGGLGVVDPLAMEDPYSEVVRAIDELGLRGIAWHNRFQRIPINAPAVKAVIDACPASTPVIAVHCLAESAMEALWRLEELLETFPERRFLAMSCLTSYSQCDAVIATARRCPNLYVEIGGLIPLGLWIEKYVEVVGADRLLFGTDLYSAPPLFRHNYAKLAVEAAQIAPADRERIFSKNAEELLELP